MSISGLSALPQVSEAALPAAVRNGTAKDKEAYKAALGFEQSVYGIAGMLTAAAVVFFAYTGFEAIANLGEETHNPRKDLRVGILGALGICALLYIGVSLVLTGMVPFASIDEGAPLAAAFNAVGQNWIGAIIAIAGCFQGMQVESDAEQVGNRTTAAVVQAIFLVIVLDAFFAVFFTYVGWN